MEEILLVNLNWYQGIIIIELYTEILRVQLKRKGEICDLHLGFKKTKCGLINQNLEWWWLRCILLSRVNHRLCYDGVNLEFLNRETKDSCQEQMIFGG